MKIIEITYRYDGSERQIWVPRSCNAQCIGLAAPPADLDAFDGFADALIRSERIVAMLDRAAD